MNKLVGKKKHKKKFQLINLIIKIIFIKIPKSLMLNIHKNNYKSSKLYIKNKTMWPSGNPRIKNSNIKYLSLTKHHKKCELIRSNN